MSRWNRAVRSFLIVLALALGVYSLMRAMGTSTDFDHFYDSARMVWNEGKFHVEKGTARYPPTFQVLVSPLGAVPLGVAATLWLLCNAAALASLPRAYQRLSGLSPTQQLPAWFAAAPFLLDNFFLGQSGPLLLALATWGVVWALGGRAVRGGVALTLAALLKVFSAAIPASRWRCGAHAGRSWASRRPSCSPPRRPVSRWAGKPAGAMRNAGGPRCASIRPPGA